MKRVQEDKRTGRDTSKSLINIAPVFIVYRMIHIHFKKSSKKDRTTVMTAMMANTRARKKNILSSLRLCSREHKGTDHSLTASNLFRFRRLSRKNRLCATLSRQWIKRVLLTGSKADEKTQDYTVRHLTLRSLARALATVSPLSRYPQTSQSTFPMHVQIAETSDYKLNHPRKSPHLPAAWNEKNSSLWSA